MGFLILSTLSRSIPLTQQSHHFSLDLINFLLSTRKVWLVINVFYVLFGNAICSLTL